MPKKFKVGFKTINAKLQVTRHHLNNIKNKVVAKDQRAIAAQIKAINVLLAACEASSRITKPPTVMSRYYIAK